MKKKIDQPTRILKVSNLALSVAGLSLLAGCGSAATSSGSGVTVSGILGTGGSDELRDEFVEDRSTSVSSYTVDCVTLGNASASSCDGSVSSSGAFSCGPLPTGEPFGCFVESGSSIVAVMAFTSSTSGLGGTNTSQGTIVAGGGSTGLNLGQITLNVSTGTAVVNMADVTSTGGSSPTTTTTSTGLASFANLERANGWTIAALPSSQVPPGVSGAVACSNGNCNGPGIGQIIFLAQYEATDAESNTHVGFSIWNGGTSAATASANYSACTTGGGEGANLPSGFTAIAGPNNNASLLTGALQITNTLPAPTSITPSGGGGSCGVTSYPTGKTCADTPTLSGFSDPDSTSDGSVTGGFGTAGKDSCVFLCVLNNIGHANSACGGQTYVDWGKMSQNVWTGSHNHFAPVYASGVWADHEASISGGGSNISFAADTGSTVPQGATASFLGGSVVFNSSSPSNRFMFGELVIAAGGSSGIGSLSNQQPSQTFSICTGGQTGTGGCPSGNQVSCTTTELDQMTITETGTDSSGKANKAIIQLTQNTTLTPSGNATNDAACKSNAGQNGGGNSIGQQMFIFEITGN